MRDVGGSRSWDLWDGEVRRPSPVGRPFYAGGLVFYNEGRDIWAIEYSESDRAFVGEPVFVASGLHLVSAAEDGTLLAQPLRASEGRERELMWVDRDGDDLEPAALLPEAAGGVSFPVRASDGQVAYIDGDQIWILGPAGESRRPIPLQGGVHAWPVWSPDNRTLYYTEREAQESSWAADIKRVDLETGEISIVAGPGSSRNSIRRCGPRFSASPSGRRTRPWSACGPGA